MQPKYVIGLDYGTNSVRTLVVRVHDGFEAGTAVFEYPHGDAGILLDSSDPNLARQHPADYLQGAEVSVRAALEDARRNDPDFAPERVIGIGVDTTGSTPLPVDANGVPLAFHERFQNNLNAMAWLWKDHTSTREAETITETAGRLRPQYLAKCGNSYSSEWFWAKVWHCLNVDPEVFESAATWVECADWIPAVLTGNDHPSRILRGVCAAGHKALYNPQWGGLPDKEFLSALHPKLAQLRDRLYDVAYTSDHPAGRLTAHWSAKLGLPEGIPVAVGAFDAHLGGVGAGIKPGTLVKIVGTSCCDMMVVPNTETLADIPGTTGIVDGSILPGYFGIELGQSAFGDIYNWFVNYIEPGGPDLGSHEALTAKAQQIKPGQSGLLALDWNNGNRSILGDQRLVGLLIGQTLHTTPDEVYRALIEATCFGSLVIMNQLEKYGVAIQDVIACGGIAEKNPLVMQILADVSGRTIRISRSSQTCALGAAIAGAVVAGKEAGGYATFEEAQRAMCGLKGHAYEPNPEAQAVYRELFALYKDLHDAFGTRQWQGNLYHVMKRLIDIRNAVRQNT